MAPPSITKRKADYTTGGSIKRPKKRFRKQKEYYSSSEESNGADVTSAHTEADHCATDGLTSDGTREADASPSTSIGGSSGDATSGDESEHSGHDHILDKKKSTSRRNDPDAFSTSISKILSTKLSQGARKDPVLARSRQATDVSTNIANDRLEKRAKAKLRADRKAELERDRVKDVLGVASGKAGEIAEDEKRLRKTAQRGVVKLFNAVRAAQVKGEEAAKQARKQGTVGHANREQKVNEMSKQGFLDLINGSQSMKQIEEAR